MAKAGSRLLLLLLLLQILLSFCAIELDPETADTNAKGSRLQDLVGCMQTSPIAMALPAMLVALQQKANHSWLQQLRPDPRQQAFVPNRTSREVAAARARTNGCIQTFEQVFSGHYVEVEPVPLPQPSLVIHRHTAPSHPCSVPYVPTSPFSMEMATELGLDDAAVKSDAFLKFFSGSSDTLPGAATPLLISIRCLRSLLLLQACARGQHLMPSALWAQKW